MMRRRAFSSIAVLLILVLVFTGSARADELADRISDMQQAEDNTKQKITDLEKQTQETQNAINALRDQKEATQNNVNALENKSQVLQSTINGYSDQLEDLSDEISKAEEALAEVSSEIVDLDQQLQAARAEEEARYALLKKRLRATYESGMNGGMLQILLESGSLQEVLTKANYLEAIVQYDFRKIEEFQALQADIKAKTAIVEQREAELDEYQTSLDENYSELADLTDEVKSQLSQTRSNVSSEKSKLADYDNQLAELDKKMKKLEKKTAAAQARLAKQIAERLELQREDTSGSYSASASELEWLAATIQAEADGESYTGKLAVGSVIMNRVKSSAFPNNVVGVITQDIQFAPYRSGKVELIISRGPNSTCLRAAEEVLDGARVGDYLFFMTQYWADYYGISEYTMIGNHAFFYRWIVKEKPQEEPEDEEGEAAEENSGEENTEDGQEASEENTEEESQPEESRDGEEGGSEEEYVPESEGEGE
ncbi:MAG: cell wall hydrolase [Lachnospiraceae bacterium]|nr:cell wall hydrolase [Lachnospiraceae bacterium]